MVTFSGAFYLNNTIVECDGEMITYIIRPGKLLIHLMGEIDYPSEINCFCNLTSAPLSKAYAHSQNISTNRQSELKF